MRVLVVKNKPIKEIEAKRDKLYKILKYRHSARRSLAIREAYDRCVQELIRRGFDEIQATSHEVTK